MVELEKQLSASELNPTGDVEAIRHLKQAIHDGKHWYVALLEAIELWNMAQETYNGRTYCYLIDGEAFDWLLLAERLCDAVNALIPEAEKIALLFHGEPPLDLPAEKFKELIGSTRYNQYLNYFYGITVEEALILAVREEVRKEEHILGYNKEEATVDEAYQRVYGAGRAALLERFRGEKDYPQADVISLTELKEFTYWLFKYRVQRCDKAKVASDTKKALERLNSLRSSVGRKGAGLTSNPS